MAAPSPKPKIKIKAVDLFCGAGGLTRGLENSGVDVAFGVDADPECRFPYETNNQAKFVLSTVEDLSPADLFEAFDGAQHTLLAGCAPCQPFSTYSRCRSIPNDRRRDLLRFFCDLVKEVKPSQVIMENVPRLKDQIIFQNFITTLVEAGYNVTQTVLNCADYGLPQRRHRLVLLASRYGPIEFIEPTHSPRQYNTVKDAIWGLPPLDAGSIYVADPLHQACSLSPLNLKRIRASKPGGTWRDWDESLLAECHKRNSGKTYPSVYGRMSWDETAPTITTQFFGFGNGRFGHPEQNRAISLREGAVLQGFPLSYKFVPEGAPVYRKSLGRLIGNAVPVSLGAVIGQSVIQHINQFERNEKKE